jgi:hypothetical protein
MELPFEPDNQVAPTQQDQEEQAIAGPSRKRPKQERKKKDDAQAKAVAWQRTFLSGYTQSLRQADKRLLKKAVCLLDVGVEPARNPTEETCHTDTDVILKYQTSVDRIPFPKATRQADPALSHPEPFLKGPFLENDQTMQYLDILEGIAQDVKRIEDKVEQLAKIPGTIPRHIGVQLTSGDFLNFARTMHAKRVQLMHAHAAAHPGDLLELYLAGRLNAPLEDCLSPEEEEDANQDQARRNAQESTQDPTAARAEDSNASS